MDINYMVQALANTKVTGLLEGQINGIQCDSRLVGPGDLFVAIRGGEEQDRHQFIPDAIARGARAVVVEDDIEVVGATCIQVENCRQAAAHLAGVYFQHPAKELALVGITGTNGKTTTAFLVRQILEAAGQACGYIGTLGYWIRDGLKEGSNTTPEAPQLHQCLRHMVDAGKRAAVLEVSSHALALGRVDGLEFRVALFTNLSRDHLDFHQNEDAYFAAKKRLFNMAADKASAVLNIDDPRGRELSEHVSLPALTYGRSKEAKVRLKRWGASAFGTNFHFDTPLGQIIGQTRLTGTFNCYNVLAAVACGLALDLDLDVVASGVESLEQVPGRFERIVEGQPYEVIVDYAHTPAGLDTVLKAARTLARGRVLCVFGCGGDRDRGKRPLMGAVAGHLADQVYLTSDNPRSEDPQAILAEIAAGVQDEAVLHVEIDRYRAIERVLSDAVPGDVVIVAGKGHETVQIGPEGSVAFDDRHVVRQILQDFKASGRGGE